MVRVRMGGKEERAKDRGGRRIQVGGARVDRRDCVSKYKELSSVRRKNVGMVPQGLR